MTTSRLSSKGQVIIPKPIRDAQGLEPGMDLEFEDHGDHIVIRPIAEAPPTTVDDVLGILPWHGRPKTLEEMDEGIARGARARR